MNSSLNLPVNGLTQPEYSENSSAVNAALEFSALSLVGPVRSENQDTVYFPGIDRDGSFGATPVDMSDSPQADIPGTLSFTEIVPIQNLFAIADGMGGYSHGKLASLLAVEALNRSLAALDLSSPGHKTLRRSFEVANTRVFQASQAIAAGHMGTTLTAALIQANHLHIGHVGDSRVYLVRDGKSTCLSSDHTSVGDLVRMKVLTPDKIRTHSQRSILTRAIGLSLFVQPDITQHKIQPGDRLILCSDGVWAMIEDDEFGQVSSRTNDVQHLSQKLIDIALDRESDDNVSVVSVEVHSTLGSASAPTSVPKTSFLRRLFQRNKLEITD